MMFRALSFFFLILGQIPQQASAQPQIDLDAFRAILVEAVAEVSLKYYVDEDEKVRRVMTRRFDSLLVAITEDTQQPIQPEERGYWTRETHIRELEDQLPDYHKDVAHLYPGEIGRKYEWEILTLIRDMPRFSVRNLNRLLGLPTEHYCKGCRDDRSIQRRSKVGLLWEEYFTLLGQLRSPDDPDMCKGLDRIYYRQFDLLRLQPAMNEEELVSNSNLAWDYLQLALESKCVEQNSAEAVFQWHMGRVYACQIGYGGTVWPGMEELYIENNHKIMELRPDWFFPYWNVGEMLFNQATEILLAHDTTSSPEQAARVRELISRAQPYMDRAAEMTPGKGEYFFDLWKARLTDPRYRREKRTR